MEFLEPQGEIQFLIQLTRLAVRLEVLVVLQVLLEGLGELVELELHL